MSRPVHDVLTLRLAVVVYGVVTVVVAVATKSTEAVAAVQLPLAPLIGGRALKR